MPTKNKSVKNAQRKSSAKSKAAKKKAPTPTVKKKIAKVMREYKDGKLHTGNKKGPVVKSRKQAIAIALSEAGVSNQE